MIELALGAALMVAASALARAVMQNRLERELAAKERAEALERAMDPHRGFRVGDVLLHLGESFWLSGAIELDEEGRRFTLFRSPENAEVSWILELDGGREVALLSECTEIPEGSVPAQLRLGGRLLSLERRGRALARWQGEHLPKLTPKTMFTLLSEPGGKTALVLDFEKGARLALFGDRKDRALLDLLPGKL